MSMWAPQRSNKSSTQYLAKQKADFITSGRNNPSPSGWGNLPIENDPGSSWGQPPEKSDLRFGWGSSKINEKAVETEEKTPKKELTGGKSDFSKTPSPELSTVRKAVTSPSLSLLTTNTSGSGWNLEKNQTSPNQIVPSNSPSGGDRRPAQTSSRGQMDEGVPARQQSFGGPSVVPKTPPEVQTTPPNAWQGRARESPPESQDQNRVGTPLKAVPPKESTVVRPQTTAETVDGMEFFVQIDAEYKRYSALFDIIKRFETSTLIIFDPSRTNITLVAGFLSLAGIHTIGVGEGNEENLVRVVPSCDLEKVNAKANLIIIMDMSESLLEIAFCRKLIENDGTLRIIYLPDRDRSRAEGLASDLRICGIPLPVYLKSALQEV